MCWRVEENSIGGNLLRFIKMVDVFRSFSQPHPQSNFEVGHSLIIIKWT